MRGRLIVAGSLDHIGEMDEARVVTVRMALSVPRRNRSHQAHRPPAQRRAPDDRRPAVLRVLAVEVTWGRFGPYAS
jgi:hypothetical protein